MKKTNNLKIKFIAVVMSLSLLFTACGGGNGGDSSGGNNSSDGTTIPTKAPSVTEPASEETTGTDKFRKELEGTDIACGVAYLGGYWYGPEYLDQYLENIGVFEDFPEYRGIGYERFVEQDGGELYLIIPRDPNATVIVNDVICDETTDWNIFPGENVLYKTENSGQPFIIRCNFSDGIPNTFITIIESDGTIFEYSPQLSLMDGSLVIPIMSPALIEIKGFDVSELGGYMDDLTDPIDLEEFWPSYWWGQYYTDDMPDPINVFFHFGENHSVEFTYESYDQDMYVYENVYSGSWIELEEDVYGYVPSSYEFVLDKVSGAEDAPERIISTQAVVHPVESIIMRMYYLDGDYLTPDCYEGNIDLQEPMG